MPDQHTITDPVTRAIIWATQQGLPLSKQPYHDIASRLDMHPQLIIRRMQEMLDQGIIRRIGIVPNHYALGYQANGTSLTWDAARTGAA